MEKVTKKEPQERSRGSSSKKKEIEEFLEENRSKIESEELLVFFLDECHLIWGDICGYVWGKTDIRIEIPVTNEKEKQTYYGAMNYRTGKVITKEYPQGNTENTIKFVSQLIRENPQQKLVIIWDGASYHRSQEWREYLDQINQGKPEEAWLVRCIRLAPNAPEQNPIEDVWLQGKEMIRRYWNLCQNFKIVKWLFSWTINQNFFSFPKLSMYGSFS
jgi:transposase